MNLTISGQHLDLTPALRTYAKSKLERFTEQFKLISGAALLLTVDKYKIKAQRQRAKITLHIKGKDIVLEKAASDLYGAIDLLAEKLNELVRRIKNRRQNHSHQSLKRNIEIYSEEE